MDVNSVGFDNPLVESWTIPKVVDGKIIQPSVAEIRAAARKSPKFDLTTKANELARQSATSLIRALGGGV
jgi:hypothetical protein